MVTMSSQSGHWRLQGGAQKAVVAIHTHLSLPLLARVFGYMPWSAFSNAEDLPRGVALAWSRWCRDRSYLLGDDTLPLDRFARFVAPVLVYSFADDDWGTARSVDAMMRAYPNLERRHRAPSDHIESVFHTSPDVPQSARMTLINDSRVRSLADRTPIEGTIVLPSDPAWDAARQAWNLAVDQRPAMVAFPESVEDVVGLVRMAEEANLAVVTQGTGHGATGYADLTNTLLIRTTRLRRLSIEGATCRAGAGALWGEVAEEARPLRLVGLAGSSPDVGVVGYTLGGGIGWLSRPYGLAANRVRSIEIVTADATVRRVDRASDPDLFWALRGGGGGLGVITSIEFDLIPIDRVYGGTISWRADRAEIVLEAWSRWTAELDESVTSIVRFLNLPPIPDVPEPFRGRRMLTVGAVAVGDRRKAQLAISALRAIGGYELDTFDDMTPADLVRLHGDPEGPTPGDVTPHTAALVRSRRHSPVRTGSRCRVGHPPCFGRDQAPGWCTGPPRTRRRRRISHRRPVLAQRSWHGGRRRPTSSDAGASRRRRRRHAALVRRQLSALR